MITADTMRVRAWGKSIHKEIKFRCKNRAIITRGITRYFRSHDILTRRKFFSQFFSLRRWNQNVLSLTHSNGFFFVVYRANLSNSSERIIIIMYDVRSDNWNRWIMGQGYHQMGYFLIIKYYLLARNFSKITNISTYISIAIIVSSLKIRSVLIYS